MNDLLLVTCVKEMHTGGVAPSLCLNKCIPLVCLDVPPHFPPSGHLWYYDKMAVSKPLLTAVISAPHRV